MDFAIQRHQQLDGSDLRIGGGQPTGSTNVLADQVIDGMTEQFAPDPIGG